MGKEGGGKITSIGEEEMRIVSVFMLAVLSLGLSGCGYTTRSMISTKYTTIYITPFINKIDITSELDTGNKFRIYRPRIETDITNAVTNKYLFDGNLKPTKKENADLVLKGEVVEYRKDPLRYNENDEVTEYRMTLFVNISLWDNKAEKMLWQSDRFSGYYEYFTSAYTLTNVTPKTDDQALDLALDDLARRVVERTVNEW